ncbi:hypothetical protein PENTCL1PPCAC_1099, partial [Pristionchus entomophagus]
AAVAPKPAPAADKYQHRRGGRRPPHMLDYSPETIAGRINIWAIAPTVKREQLVNLLTPIDPCFELTFPHTRNEITRGFAYAKFKSNDKADEAVRRLNRTLLNGVVMHVKRTPFWFKDVPSSLFPTKKTLSVGCDTVNRDVIDGDTAEIVDNNSIVSDSMHDVD